MYRIENFIINCKFKIKYSEETKLKTVKKRIYEHFSKYQYNIFDSNMLEDNTSHMLFNFNFSIYENDLKIKEKILA